MERKKWRINIIIGFILLISLIYWLFCGRILSIDTNGKDLSQFVNLTCFELLEPDMSRTEISKKMGQPTKVDVTDIIEEEDYVEIRWIYERSNGLLNYYVEQYDVPGGSVEYIPKNMSLSDFLLEHQKILFGKRFVEINNGKTHLITIMLKGNKKIEKINWYNKNI